MLEARFSTELFKAPAADAAILKTISVSARIPLDEISRPGPDWVEVTARYPRPLQGFIRAADVVDVDESSVLPVDLWSFVEFCSLAAATYNEQTASSAVGISRDYLLALALVLNDTEGTDITEGFPAGFDPYRFTKAEWTEFCGSGSNTGKYRDYDRRDPLAQIDGTVYFTAEWTGEIVHARTNPAAGGGPYVPNSIELFLTHMLGKAGVAALSDPSQPWEGYVGAAGGNTAAIQARYPRFLQSGKSVAEILDLIETAFDTAYATVAKVVDGVDGPPPAGEPAWLVTARTEEQRHIREPNPRIADYFTATDYGSPTARTAWCGAFVAFCLAEHGEKPPKGAARAANWASWGKALAVGGDIPLGAVVVLSPAPGTNASGHVAFFAGADANPKRIQLLGGNQSDALGINSFERKRVVAIRWPAEEATAPRVPAARAIAGAVDIGLFSHEDWTRYCTTLGKRESNNNYAAVNSRGYCGRWQFGALVLIDLGYVRLGSGQRQLGNAGFWTGKDNISSRDRWLADHSVQDAAMLALTRRNFRQLVKMGVLSEADTPERVAGMLAAAHLVGCGGAADLARNRIRKDGNNVTSQAYYDLLAREFA